MPLCSSSPTTRLPWQPRRRWGSGPSPTPLLSPLQQEVSKAIQCVCMSCIIFLHNYVYQWPLSCILCRCDNYVPIYRNEERAKCKSVLRSSYYSVYRNISGTNGEHYIRVGKKCRIHSYINTQYLQYAKVYLNVLHKKPRKLIYISIGN